MNNDRKMKNINDLNALDLELLEALLASEDTVYPWNPADVASEAYFDDLEQHLKWQDFSAIELMESANNFYLNLDKIWRETAVETEFETENIRNNTGNDLQKALSNAFSVIPEVLLTKIAQKATQLLMVEKSASSEIEQAKISLAIANYALEYLSTSNPRP